MNDKHLHIVTHNVPYPVDHGGLTDLFYKLKALHLQGVHIYLHCFTQGRTAQPELEKYCTTVYYYPRKIKISRFSLQLPFIVNSRKDTALLDNLLKDKHPILLEGIHCTYFLGTGQLEGRAIYVRLHNTEFLYYQSLARLEKNPIKKLYFMLESRLLKKYERRIAGKAVFLAVNRDDADFYRIGFNAKRVHYLPIFLPYTLSAGQPGRGFYCLYHGNLGISENVKAAIWLLEKVFSKTLIPFVIAGKAPSAKLQRLAHVNSHTCIVANPPDKEMHDLIAKAQVHVLPSFNQTGIKLKLLNALFNGRHCLVNQAAVAGTILGDHCHIATDPHSFIEQLSTLYQRDFTEQEMQKRQGLLLEEFNNNKNAEKLVALIWG